MAREKQCPFPCSRFQQRKAAEGGSSVSPEPGEPRAGIDPAVLGVTDVPSSSQVAFGSSADAERSLHANKSFDIHSGAVSDLLTPQHLHGKHGLWIPFGCSPSP